MKVLANLFLGARKTLLNIKLGFLLMVKWHKVWYGKSLGHTKSKNVLCMTLSHRFQLIQKGILVVVTLSRKF